MTTSSDPLDSLVHLSHRLGHDTRLVQPGGGNTSIKVGDALLVKGSGTDLRTIGREGFTRLSLSRLAPLAEAEAMSDAEMMRFMAGCMLAEGPAPSVETPLHSLLPHRVIAHTHDVADDEPHQRQRCHGGAAGGRAVRGRDPVRPVQPARLSAGAIGERHGGPDPGGSDRPHAGAPRAGGLGRRRGARHTSGWCRSSPGSRSTSPPAGEAACTGHARSAAPLRRSRSAGAWRSWCCRRCGVR